MSKIAETVEALIRPLVESMGVTLMDVEFNKEPQSGYILTVYIDKEGGVSTDDCERVSVAIDPVLDEADPIAQSYYLCVSSPGLDRPLKKDADFLRSIGKRVTAKLYAPIEKKKEITGILSGFDAENIELELDGQKIKLVRSGVSIIKPEIEF